jgi:tRNA 2-thiouridine synthesizing protein E
MSEILFNPEGYLLDPLKWNEALAEELAQLESLSLSEQHWQILRALRQFYQQYATLPTLRAFLNYLHRELNLNDIDSAQLYALFPKGPILQGAKIAGLPKPKHCI